MPAPIILTSYAMGIEPALPVWHEAKGTNMNLPVDEMTNEGIKLVHRTPHDEYTRAVEAGLYPFAPTVPLPEPFKNENGTIQNLLEKDCATVTIIESKDGAIRANHYHRTDWHYTYVVRGRVFYYEREIGGMGIPEPFVYGPGQMFFTPPMREHAMRFEGDTTILTMSRRHRTPEEHEADVVRVDFLGKRDHSLGEMNGR